MLKFKKYWLLGILAIPVAYYSYALAAYSYIRHTVAGSQIYELYSDGTVTLAGPLKSGNNYTATSITLPTTTTGSNFAHWLPVTNIGTSALVQGDVVVSSNVSGGVVYVQKAPATTDLTTVVGVAAEAIAAGAKGWMVPRGGGYAVVKTTGTVTIGDTLVSTSSASGYLTGDSTPTSGADVGTALSVGTAAGGTIIALLH